MPPITPLHPHRGGVQSRRAVQQMAAPCWSSIVKRYWCCVPTALRAMCQSFLSQPKQSLACYICEFPFAFSCSCPTLGVLCANIIKNIEYTIIREHKLRKRVVFSLDMVSFRNKLCLQCHRRVLPNTQFPVEWHTKVRVRILTSKLSWY